MAFGRHSFVLDRPDDNGVTQREQLQRVQQQTGVAPPELVDEPRLPELCQRLWEWFGELAATRQNGFAANPISFMEIDAWSRLTRTRPALWEIKAIRALDAELLRLSHDEQKEKTKAKNVH